MHVPFRGVHVCVWGRSVTASSTQRRRHRPWYRKLDRDRVLMGVLGLLVLLFLVFCYQALRASQSLRLAANQAELLQNQIIAGDDTAAKGTLVELNRSTERARTMTDGLLWDVGAHVPFLGRNVRAVQTVSEVADQVSTQALPPVVKLSKQINLKTFSPRNGRIDLDAVRAVRPSLETADRAMTSADERLASIDATSLLVPLRGPVSAIQQRIDGATAATASSALASRLLPPMLGEDGTRRYLLLVQNNAEVRSTGGIPGSFAIITAKDGRLSMGRQGSAVDLPPFDRPVLPMTTDEAAMFAPTLVRDFRDTNFTPDFPRTGEIARAMVQQGLDTKVDGVISVDPIAMSYLLAGTGPVSLGDGVLLDQANAVDTLLNRAYLVLDPIQQDNVFEVAARKIFDQVKSGRGDARLIITGLVQAADENRLMVWATDSAEQQEIGTTGLAGALTGDDGRTPHLGVYLGDAGSSKMEYYLDYTTTAASRRCLAGDVQELTTSTQLTSNAPSNAAKLPPSVTGTGIFAPRGTMKLVVRLVAPFGGGFTEVRVDGRKQPIYADRLNGRNITRALVSLDPGDSVTLTSTMISGRGQDGDAVLSTTPGVRPTRNDLPVPSACG